MPYSWEYNGIYYDILYIQECAFESMWRNHAAHRTYFKCNGEMDDKRGNWMKSMIHLAWDLWDVFFSMACPSSFTSLPQLFLVGGF